MLSFGLIVLDILNRTFLVSIRGHALRRSLGVLEDEIENCILPAKVQLLQR